MADKILSRRLLTLMSKLSSKHVVTSPASLPVCGSCLRLIALKYAHRISGRWCYSQCTINRQIHFTVASRNYGTSLDDSTQKTEKMDNQNNLKENDSLVPNSVLEGRETEHPDNRVLFDVAKDETDDVDVVAYHAETNLDLSKPIKKHHSYRNFRPLVKKSPVLSYLLLMGVNLWKIQKKGQAGLLLRLDMKRDVLPLMFVLHNAGLGETTWAEIITKHPAIFEEDIGDIEVRLNYLSSKNFTKEMIERIVTCLPSILSMSTVEVDSKLGFYQKFLKLTGEQLRDGVVMFPSVIECDKDKFMNNCLIMKRMFEFESKDLRTMFAMNSKIFTLKPENIVETVRIVNNILGLDRETMKKFPSLFTGDMNSIVNRHQYLVQLGRAQYDPKSMNYVPADALSEIEEDVFLRDIAKTSKEDYYSFMKTL